LDAADKTQLPIDVGAAVSAQLPPLKIKPAQAG
jgi:hypothetical protein